MKKWFAVAAVVAASLLPFQMIQASLVKPVEKVELYAEGDGKLPAADVEAIVDASLKQASVGNVLWKRLGSNGGVIEIQGGKESSYAIFNIVHDGKSMILEYKDSRGLKYRKDRNGRTSVHPAYNAWVKVFVKALTDNASSLKQVKLITGKQKHIKDSRAQGAALVVIAAEADPGHEGNKRMNNARWSTLIMEKTARAINEDYAGKLVAKPLEWNKQTIRIARKGYKAGYNKLACDDGADRVVTVKIDFNYDDNTWQTFRDARYNYYDCKSGRLFSKIMKLTRNSDDSFPYEGAFHATVLKFLKDNGVYD
ncbi:MAG: hypothetical protein OEZ10_01325 [Gammaproteobacteria bacterium]|nr:hypothetical protein [Gammaproteobacteria bacterium]